MINFFYLTTQFNRKFNTPFGESTFTFLCTQITSEFPLVIGYFVKKTSYCDILRHWSAKQDYILALHTFSSTKLRI